MPIEKTICKFRCIEVGKTEGSGIHVKLAAQYDQNLPEDQRFNKASPQGNMDIWIDNPIVVEAEFFVPGKQYYLEVKPAN